MPEWVAQQKKVFTKWVNMHLKKKDIKVQDITEEFCDGINLCALMELLSNKPLPHKPSTKTTTPYMRCQNLNIGFKLIGSEGIKLVGVGAEDLEQKNEKLLLGLIWTLIQFYQISMKKTTGGSGTGGRTVGSKEVLMNWVKAHLQTIPGITVKDFHQSWQDGQAFCALVKRALPDCIDLSQLKNGNRIDTLNLAFATAERELGIPRLLDAEDIANSDKPDEQSIMTYVSLFPEVYETRGIPTPEVDSHAPPKEVVVPPSPAPMPPIVEEDTKVQDMEAELEKLKALLHSAERRIEDSELNFKDQLAANESASAKLKKDVQELQDTLAAHEKHRCPDVSGVESEMEHLKCHTKEREDEIAKLREMLKNLQQQDDQQTTNNDNLVAQLAREREDRLKLQEALSELNEKLEKAREEQAAASSERERELREKCERLEKEKEEEHTVLVRERRDSSATINDLKALCDQLAREKEFEEQKTERTRRDSRAELETLSQEILNIRDAQNKTAAQYEEEIEKLKQKVTEAESTKHFPVSGSAALVFGHHNRGRKYSISSQANMLHEATKAGDYEMVAHLLESGFPVDARDANGNTPLQVASELGSENGVNMLLSYKADPNAHNNLGFTPLLYASRAGHLPVVKILLARHVEVNAKNNADETSLLLATENSHTEVIETLLSAGANVLITKSDNGWGPLYTTCWHGNARCAELIIAAGADVDAVTSKGWSPLFAAAANGHLEIVKLLHQKYKANLNALDYQMATPLMHCILENRYDVSQYLLENGADINEGGYEGWKPIHAAIYNDNVRICQLLGKYNPDVNVQCKELNMYTPLQLAIASTRPVLELISYLLKVGADPNVIAQGGSTALHIAAHYGHEEIVKMLVGAGAQLGVKNSKGKTPVRIAAGYGYENIVKFLASKQGIKEPHLKHKTPKFKSSPKPEAPTVH